MVIKNELDHYWGLDNYSNVTKEQLKHYFFTAGYAPLSLIDTKRQLVEEKQRKDCGLLSYRLCTADELLRFARDRKTLSPALQQQSKQAPEDIADLRAEIVESLCEADREPKFEKFLDLPPELRKRVHKCYVEDFPRTLFTPTQPPAARTSRLMRQEVLEIFYKSKIFGIELFDYGYLRRYGAHDLFGEHPNTGPWLEHLSAVDLSNIRNLRVVVPEQNWVIMLGKTGANYRVVADEHKSSTVKRELCKMIDELKPQGGKKRFSVDDIRALAKAVEAGYHRRRSRRRV